MVTGPFAGGTTKTVVFVKGNGLAADGNRVNILLDHGSGHFIRNKPLPASTPWMTGALVVSITKPSELR